MRIGADGEIELFAPADGRRLRGRLLFGSARGSSGLMSSGEAVSVGGDPLMMNLGDTLVRLEPLAAARFGQAVPRAAAPAAAPTAPPQTGAAAVAGPGGGALAGVRLERVRSSSFGSGSFSQTVYRFCSDGSFQRESQSSTGGTLLHNSEERGSWQLQGAALQLVSREGRRVLQLQRLSAQRMTLDGEPFVIGRAGC